MACVCVCDWYWCIYVCIYVSMHACMYVCIARYMTCCKKYRHRRSNHSWNLGTCRTRGASQIEVLNNGAIPGLFMRGY